MSEFCRPRHVEDELAPVGQQDGQIDAVERRLGDRPHEQIRDPGLAASDEIGVRWGIAAGG